MSPQPPRPPGPPPAPVEIEVETDKVDASLDVGDLLERIAHGAAAAAADPGAGHKPEVVERLQTTSKLAEDLSAQLKGIHAADPQLPRVIGRMGRPGGPPGPGPRQ